MKPRTSGHALATLVVLLLAFALLALSAAAAALVSLATAGQETESALAQQAAEAAVRHVLADWPADTDLPAAPAWPDLPPEITASARVRSDAPDLPAPWADGASLGDDGEGVLLRHYTIVATGRARRGATAVVEQGFTVLEPAP
jgi:Tfp pilus assembly protein PilX